MKQKAQQNCLFSEEEMLRMEPNSLWSTIEDPKPVVCLGKEFESDDARREYFRAELRKKLPELRQIEGFPIGEDDDIINLSDPPYYTACPNPWLNDFIAEWEKEKEQLKAEGKRTDKFELKEPYAYGIQQGKNSAIYNAHSYHTKVPHEVIMRYILHYTQPGDIVVDGFAGTGMTGVAAAACGTPTGEAKSEIEADFKDNGFPKPNWGKRHAICGDLSPICFHISSNYNSRIDTGKLKLAVNEIIEKLKTRFGHFYEYPISIGNVQYKGHINYFVWSEIVGCKNCGQELNVHDLSFDYESKTAYKKLTCPNCGTQQDKSDTISIKETVFDNIENTVVNRNKFECCLLNYSIPQKGRFFADNVTNVAFHEFIGYIPTDTFLEGDELDRPTKLGYNVVGQIYHPRTQYVLAYLNHLITTEYAQFQKPLMFIFTSMLPKMTRMNRYMPQHGSRALVGPMANTLYIPPQGVENNPIDQFEYQAGKVIKAFEQCNNTSAVQICSATHSSIPDESVDYVFTDPPFGANIMYSELNYISESWLRVKTNNAEEAISNKTQHKGLPEYQNIMTAAFKEYNRILKPGRWMTVEFSNTSAAFWNSLQYAIKSAGFIISAITDLNKERGGLHAMLGPVAVKQDLAISCYKPSNEVSSKILTENVDLLWDMVHEHLSHTAKFIHKDGKTLYITERDPRIIYDRVISYYVQRGLAIPIDANKFQQELKEHFVERDGMYFSPSDAAYYEEHKKKSLGFQSLALIISSEQEGIHWLQNELEKKHQTRSDLHPKWMAALGGGKRGDIIPDLKQLLEENFIQNEDKTWRLPNVQDDKDVNTLRTRSLLKEFATYVEAAQKPKVKIKEARVDALRAGFKQCYIDKDFKTIVMVGDRIPQNLRDEDEVLLQFYDIALNKM